MKPILFNTEMVRAILDGRKTVTRRVVNAPVLNRVRTPDKVSICANEALFSWNGPDIIGGFSVKQPYRPGDILYVRETWAHPSLREVNAGADPEKYLYKADSPLQPCAWGRWHPSIHMPKEAARLFLRVTDVRVERLKGITELGALAEGIKDPYDYQAPAWYEQHNLTTSYSRDAFAGLWNSTVKKADLPLYGWDANPWVWVIEFERISKEEATQDET